MLKLHYIMCEFQVLLLIGFEKGETDKVLTNVNLQNIIIFKKTENFEDDS